MNKLSSCQWFKTLQWSCELTLTHSGRVMHICIGNLTIIASDNGLSPNRRQAITWTNDRILLIGPLGTNFSEILIEIHTFSFKKMHLKMPSAKRRPFCLGLNVLMLTVKYLSSSVFIWLPNPIIVYCFIKLCALWYQEAGIILHMGLANERRGYTVKPPFIGCAHTQNGHWEATM